MATIKDVFVEKAGNMAVYLCENVPLPPEKAAILRQNMETVLADEDKTMQLFCLFRVKLQGKTELIKGRDPTLIDECFDDAVLEAFGESAPEVQDKIWRYMKYFAILCDVWEGEDEDE